MAERCSRCSHERRFIRKELTKWQKNVLLVVGMERVAQELMGGRKWRKLMNPFNSLEQREPQDWSQSETCYFCNRKTQSPYDSIDSVVPPCDELLDDNTSNNNNSGDKCSLCAGLSTPNSDCLLCSCKSSHSPVLNDQPLDLSMHSRHKTSVNADTHSEDASDLGDNENSLIKVPQPSSTTKATKRSRLPTTSTWKRTYTEQELQAALRDIQSGKLGTRRAAVIYGIPRSTLRNKVYKLALDRSNGKRKVNTTSTATSNTTTTNASSTGKKCTKSTVLNNTKNDNEDENKSANLTLNNIANISNMSNMSNILDEANNSSSTSASESLKQLLKNAITQRANISSGNSGISAGKIKSTQSNQLSSQLNLGSQSTTPSVGLSPAFNNITDLYNNEALATIQMLSTIECGQALAPLFTQFLLNIHQLALAKHYSEDNSEDLTNLTSTTNIPILPDLIRKLAEDQIVQTARTNSNSNQLSNRDKHEPQQEVSGNSNNNVILKVPSYKPKTSSAVTTSELCKQQLEKEQHLVTSSDNNEPVNKCSTSSSHIESDDRINDIESKSFSLKEIIAKSISQRMYNPLSAKFSANVANSEDSSSDALVSDDKYSGGCDLKNNNSGNVSDHSNPSTPEKRNRPKRGRYRNYNRDDLAKAVKAVQRGEMSVHRAGTLFGVPHSTLEYKVKERHLLRPKKRHHNDSSLGTKKESATKSNGNSSKSVLNGSSSVSSNNSAITAPDNNSIGLPFWQSAFPFFPVDVNNSANNSANFFASNMMRKLQENARMNEEVIKNQNDSNSEYGGLLLESLIKSSLVNNSLNTKRKSDVEEDDDKEVVNTSLAVLKEVSALGKKE